MNQNSSFDCIAFKREAHAPTDETIKDTAPEQEIEYFRDAVRNGPLGDWRRRISQDPNGGDPSSSALVAPAKRRNPSTH